MRPHEMWSRRLRSTSLSTRWPWLSRLMSRQPTLGARHVRRDFWMRVFAYFGCAAARLWDWQECLRCCGRLTGPHDDFSCHLDPSRRVLVVS